MKFLKISFFTLMASMLAAGTTLQISADDRATYLQNISAAARDKSLCKIPESLLERAKAAVGNDLYSSFKKIEKKNQVDTDDRVIYYLICGDTIKIQDAQKYAELFGGLTTVQKAALTLRTVVAALKYPKASCSAIGLLGGELGSFSDITKALICHACYKTKFPASGSSVHMSMFEQTADWKAIMATCGKITSNEICKQEYQASIPAGEFKNKLVTACKSRGQ